MKCRITIPGYQISKEAARGLGWPSRNLTDIRDELKDYAIHAINLRCEEAEKRHEQMVVEEARNGVVNQTRLAIQHALDAGIPRGEIDDLILDAAKRRGEAA